ncbi:MAG: F0F1 ATP synthase subunit B [Planctomycetaceae bacterium]|nr:F0F1 ATP synthase subunit B [Planctomycetaceae bacterium]
MIRFITTAVVLLNALPVLAADHGKEVSLNPLEWASNTAFWTFVIFAAVCAILGKLAFKPIAKALDDREQSISGQIEAAAKANEEAKSVLALYNQKLDESREEVRQIIEAAKKDAQSVADGIVAKAREAAGQERDRAMKEIDSAATAALQNIAERSATLATSLAGKMIRVEVKPETHRDMIQEALNGFKTVS